MQSFFAVFRFGGWTLTAMLVLACLGLLLSVIVLLLGLARLRAARPLATLLLVLVAGILGLGWVGVRAGHKKALRALAGEGPQTVEQQRQLAQGHVEARAAARFALSFAALPGLVGLGVLALRRKGEGAPGSLGAPALEAPPTEALGALEAAAAWGAVLLVGVAAVADVREVLAPRPGRELDPEDPAWELLRTAERARLTQEPSSCAELCDALGGAQSARLRYLVPESPAILARCSMARVDEVLTLPPASRASALRQLAEGEEVDPAAKDRALALLQELGVAEPKASSGISEAKSSAPEPLDDLGNPEAKGLDVQGEADRASLLAVLRSKGPALRACLDRARKRAPELLVRLELRLSIDAAGRVKAADALPREVLRGKAPWRLDASARPCWVHTLQGALFPAPASASAEVKVRLPVELGSLLPTRPPSTP